MEGAQRAFWRQLTDEENVGRAFAEPAIVRVLLRKLDPLAQQVPGPREGKLGRPRSPRVHHEDPAVCPRALSQGGHCQK